MRRLRKCPFCGGEVTESGFVPDFSYHEGIKKWLLHHFCLNDDSLEHGVSVWITGKTKQEVIDKWNGEWHEQEYSTD